MKKLKLDEQLIKTLYLQGFSSMSISKQLNCSEGTIQKYVKKHGIGRTHAEATKTRCYRKKSVFNENYFENIDTEEKAYWLGFLFADGYISKNLKKVVLSLAETEPLDKILICIQSNQKYGTYYSKNKCYYSLHITSEKMVSDLIKLGCTNRKTFTLEYPNLKSRFHRHFIRGYFDGDGSVYFNKPIGNCVRPSVSFVGTERLLCEIKKHLSFLNLKLTLGVRHKERNNNIRYFRLDGKRACKLFEHYIYNNATVFLERKRNKFRQI